MVVVVIVVAVDVIYVHYVILLCNGTVETDVTTITVLFLGRLF